MNINNTLINVFFPQSAFRHLVVSILILATLGACAKKRENNVIVLKANHLTNPIGLESVPTLSWQISGQETGLRQLAYQVLVASRPEKLTPEDADLWDSGKITSSQSQNIPYPGKELGSGERAYWKVRVWDKADKPTLFSEEAFWEMGLLNMVDWEAEWISHVPPSDSVPPVLPSPYFRKEFVVEDQVSSARLYISGLGYYEAKINGNKVGDHVLDPVLTRYDKRVKYVVHDVTNLLENGENAIGVVLGNGWYNQHTRTAWDFDQAPWRESPSLLVQLIITTENGKEILVATDSTWRFSEGPILFNGVHNGETYDARKELGDWANNGFDDDDWKNALEVPGPQGKLSAQLMPPIRIIDQLSPSDTWHINDSVSMIDLGQNITGWAKLKVKGPAGGQVKIRYGERIYEDGTLDQEELSRFIWTGDTQTDRYLLKGEGEEHFHPIFTYHGFQYMEITRSDPSIEILEQNADVVHTDLTRIGDFKCSNEMFNQLHKNIGWSFLGNYHGYPTDCPHREKMGWTGDAMLVAEVGLYNFDMTQSYLKWLDDYVDEQREDGDLPGIIPTSGWGYTYGNREEGYGPQWEGAFMEIPWQLYRYTGDKGIIASYYPYLKKYVGSLTIRAQDHLLDLGIDDHKQLENLTDGPFISSAYYYYFTSMLSKMAGLTGNTSDAESYADLATAIKSSFNKKYFDEGSGTYYHGGQAPMALALYLGLVDESNTDIVLKGLLDAIANKGGHIDAGVVGTKAVINVLLEKGEHRVLYEMANKREFPGWGYWVDELGANTMFQNWDGSQSRNHIMFGSIGDYFYKGLAGILIEESEPGFGKIVIRPDMENDITWVEAYHESPYGKIGSKWQKSEESSILEIEIPGNTKAEIWIKPKFSNSIRLNGKEVKETRESGDYKVIEVEAGMFKVEF